MESNTIEKLKQILKDKGLVFKQIAKDKIIADTSDKGNNFDNYDFMFVIKESKIFLLNIAYSQAMLIESFDDLYELENSLEDF